MQIDLEQYKTNGQYDSKKIGEFCIRNNGSMELVDQIMNDFDRKIETFKEQAKKIDKRNLNPSEKVSELEITNFLIQVSHVSTEKDDLLRKVMKYFFDRIKELTKK